MNKFTQMNEDRRQREINDANRFNGRDGYHQYTGTQYKDGKPVSTYNPATDRYTYHKDSTH